MASLADLDPLAALGLVGDRPQPGTLGYEELKRRQTIAAAMASGRRREFPKTFGEGLTSLGEAVGERMNDDRIAKMAQAQRAAEGGVAKGAPGTLAPGVGGGLAVPPVATAPAAAAVPAAAPAAAASTFQGTPYKEVPVRKTESDVLKDKLAALLTGGEVPQENPTLAAETPQEAGGPQPNVQLAALPGAGGGTLSDAPPPGAGVPAPPVDDTVTPTDIKPMPVRTAQMGVPPSGVLPGSASMMSSDFTRGAPPPSSQPIPPETTEKPPVVRPEPKQPEIMGPTKAMAYWSRYMNNPNVSPEMRAHAKQIYDTEAHYVKELQQRRDANFVHERTQRAAEQLRLATWEIEEPVRKIDQHIKRLQIEKTLATTPLEIAKLNGEIKAQEIAREKAAYEITQRKAEERGKLATTQSTEADVEKKAYEVTQRPFVEDKERLAREQAQRTLDKPDEHTLNGVIYQKPRGAKEWAPAPGSPSDDKLTEKQMSTVKFLQRATVATSIIGDGNELRGFKDTAAGRVPVGGNYLVSPEYQRKKSAMHAWGKAVLRDESGAVLNDGEIASKLTDYFPQPGDSDQLVAEKKARRQYEEQSLYHSLGDKKKAMDTWYENRKSQKVDKPEGYTETSNKGRTRRVIGGHWVYPDEW